MKQYKSLKRLVIGATALVGVAGAQAYQANCSSNLSAQFADTLSVTNALNGGFCYFVAATFQASGSASDIPALVNTYKTQYPALNGLSLIDENGTVGSNPNALIAPTPSALNGGGINPSSSNKAAWSFSPSLWQNYTNLFLGFHFGDGSFIVQLDPQYASGQWWESSTQGCGLSNFYLFGSGTGKKGGGNGAPEPASLALVALGLLGAAAARRRTSR